ncbi:arylamine N-acetyltransferase [Pseudoalteromonas luteoviolacea]|uniref:arylamine N-acetyltransferase family protein n=1 Tax=Pseudoalteromonas luteoviolacea TaxID=43657 RepID=UPI001B3A46CD|nr:arylamine N-acetyltransferase [Pseudoalteromonas luteoviolacea]MBQ4878416.1 arylamine N-acetyltransferase [Pseudoalteromonas luteoviolacea]MBQ4907571.1 arylamine N-acetyltransferase [Pseudoalteromonas luteoviolacea]
MTPSQLALYLSKLGLETPKNCNLAFVEQLIKAHLARFSFSSINAMQDKLLSLEFDVVFARVVEKEQGGYCFEHNKILMQALQSLGFDVSPLLARVLLNGKWDNPRSHRVTLLKYNHSEYLIDVGFGSKTPRILIPIDNTADVCDENYAYHIERSAQCAVLTLISPKSIPLYDVEFSETFESDCDVAHFHCHQHPDSLFVNHLALSRMTKTERHTLNNLLYVYRNEETAEVHETLIKDVAQLKAIIKEAFLLIISEHEINWVYDKAALNMLETH